MPVRIDSSLLPARWPQTEAEAVAEQERLRGLVRPAGAAGAAARWIAGVDVSYARESDLVVAAVVVLDGQSAGLDVVEQRTASGRSAFPYLPGALAFRELPILFEALQQVAATPDVFVCDGYGLAHPRRFGLASHLGVLAGTPSVGVGKTAFIGEYEEPGPRRGDWTGLTDQGEVIGRVLRTQDAVKPVYVSVGHLIGLAEAADLVLRLSPRYRLPETTRAADHLLRAVLAGDPTAAP